MSQSPSVLIVISHYLPGYQAGGPIRSIANLINWLGNEFSFSIITTNRDFGSEQPYAGIEAETWLSVGKARVFYASPDKMGLVHWYRYLTNNTYDILYLNSFFASSTIRILLLYRLRLLPQKPIVLAPRGEFSIGALGLKSLKKRTYIRLVKWIRLYNPVRWQASSHLEQQDIIRTIAIPHNCQIDVKIAPNLAPKRQLTSGTAVNKTAGSLRMVFLSRISPMKNLDFALKLILQLRGSIIFDLYGPIEDKTYWQECQKLIQNMPPAVHVRYCGAVDPDSVGQVFSHYHLFLFPTRGENFGHVILEALRAGCPVLISDQTPWLDLTENKAGWALPLSRVDEFQEVLQAVVDMDNVTQREWSECAQLYGEKAAYNAEAIIANQQLFLEVLRK